MRKAVPEGSAEGLVIDESLIMKVVVEPIDWLVCRNEDTFTRGLDEEPIETTWQLGDDATAPLAGDVSTVQGIVPTLKLY